MTTRQKANLGCLQATHAQDFILGIHIDELGQHMSLVVYFTILIYLLMIPLFPIYEEYSICLKVCMDTFGKHALHCKELPDYKYKHKFVWDVILYIYLGEREYY